MIIYCPICQKELEAINVKEVESGEHEGYVFVHDDKPHPEDVDYTESRLQ